MSNPANLDGAQLSSSSALQPAAVRGSIEYDTSKTSPPSPFADLKYPSDVPFGMRPHAMKLQVSLTRAIVTGTCAFPENVKLTVQSFSAAVSDASGQAILSGQPNLTVTLTKTSSGLASASYAVSQHTLSVSADRAATDQAINILTSGGQNHASAGAQILADKDELAGCSIQFTLGGTSITLSNFS